MTPDLLPELLGDGPDPELEYMKTLYRAEFRRAIELRCIDLADDSASRTCQATFDTGDSQLQYAMDVGQRRAFEIVEVFQAMRELPAVAHLLDCEADFLEGDTPMLILAEDIDRCALECTKETALVRSLVVLAFAVIRAIPGVLVAEEPSGAV